VIRGVLGGLVRQIFRLLRTVIADVALTIATILLLVAAPLLILTAGLAAFAYLQRPAAPKAGPVPPARAAVQLLTALVGLAQALRDRNPST